MSPGRPGAHWDPGAPGGPPLRIAIIGAGEASPRERTLAAEAGAAIARAGAVLVCGGLGGVMEAAARGCAEAGGLTVGLLPGDDPGSANPWIRIPLPTGLGEARNLLVARSGDAVVAVGGRWGTLSEIAFARKSGIAVAVLGRPPAEGLDVERFEAPAEAVTWAVARARERRSPGDSRSAR